MSPALKVEMPGFCLYPSLEGAPMEDGSLARVLRRLQGGQVCLPAEFRRRLGIAEEGLLLLTLKEDKIELTPVDRKSVADMGWTRERHAMFKLAGQEAHEMDEAQINALINEALNGAESEDCD
jgi:AbrB family looped-hinge helix DNA binding protein